MYINTFIFTNFLQLQAFTLLNVLVFGAAWPSSSPQPTRIKTYFTLRYESRPAIDADGP